MQKYLPTDNLESTGLLVLGVMIFIVALFLIGFYYVTPIFAGSYNRSAAVSYADKWAHSRNSYYNDYSNDCANFASQSMWAGGLPRIPSCNASACQTDSVSNIYQWWYAPTTHVNSKTWSATDWMNQHFSQYQGSRFQIYSSATNLQAGDILLMQIPPSTIPSHARVIVGLGNSVECVDCNQFPLGSYGLLADQHTADRKRVRWNDQVPSSYPLWSWHIVW